MDQPLVIKKLKKQLLYLKAVWQSWAYRSFVAKLMLAYMVEMQTVSLRLKDELDQGRVI